MTTLNPGLILLASGCRAALVTSLWWGVASSAAAAFLAAPQAPRSAGERPAAVAVETPAETAAPEMPRITRVRSASSRAAAILVEGPLRSAIFARLLNALEHSDVFVYVETGYLKIPSQLRFAAATPAGRFLRITLNVPEAEDRLIGWLAHELQHAVEVAGAPAVTSPATLARYYAAHGERAISEGSCTREAQRITSLVLAEVGATWSARR